MIKINFKMNAYPFWVILVIQISLWRHFGVFDDEIIYIGDSYHGYYDILDMGSQFLVALSPDYGFQKISEI